MSKVYICLSQPTQAGKLHIPSVQQYNWTNSQILWSLFETSDYLTFLLDSPIYGPDTTQGHLRYSPTSTSEWVDISYAFLVGALEQLQSFG